MIYKQKKSRVHKTQTENNIKYQSTSIRSLQWNEFVFHGALDRQFTV